MIGLKRINTPRIAKRESNVLSKPSLKSPQRGNTAQKIPSEVFKPGPRLAPMTSLRLHRLKLPKLKSYWGPFIHQGRLLFIVGTRGVGKSHFVLALAVSMATGKPFLGHAPTRPIRVVILDGEMDLRTLKVRLNRTLTALDASPTKNLTFISPEMTSETMPNLGTIEGQEEMEQILGKNWDVLIIDNYSAFSGGREDADAWSPWDKWLMKLRRAGHTIIMIHHANKKGGQRGASNHEDHMDASITVSPPKYPAKDGSLQLVVQWTKGRHTSADIHHPLLATYSKDVEGNHRWSHSYEIDADPMVAKALKLQRDGKSMAEIGKELGKDKSTISRWLTEHAKTNAE